MRKLLLSVWMCMVVLAASCGRSMEPSCIQKEVDVSFDVDVAQPATKAYGDGMTVNTVHVYAYLKDPVSGKLSYIDPVTYGENCPTKTLGMEGGKAPYITRLVMGQEYVIVFWADYQSDDYDSPYTYDSASHTISIKYHNNQAYAVPANDERRDAFYAVETITVNGAIGDRTVRLKRPFAQVNIGITDSGLADAASKGITLKDLSVTFSNVATKIDLVTSEVYRVIPGDDHADYVPFKANSLPNQKFMVGGVEYNLISMNYVLVDQNEEGTVAKNISLISDGGKYKRQFSNVTLRANYKTNIVGDIINVE
ncbi:MAG TPA: hypothetical protein DCW53_05500 [Rikenellaceae bacterium]|nr:hypothetical protein [Rikenellaceae bacterium]